MTPGNEAPVTDAFILGIVCGGGKKGNENYGGGKRGGIFFKVFLNW